MLMFHAENGQDFFDMILKAYVIADQPDVHLPVGVFADGFFVTHTREKVMLPSKEAILPCYDPSRAPVPPLDMETPPIRTVRDPKVYIIYQHNMAIFYYFWHQCFLSPTQLHWLKLCPAESPPG